jgi:hypothetical protein
MRWRARELSGERIGLRHIKADAHSPGERHRDL